MRSRPLLQFLAAVCQLRDVCVRQRQFRKLALLLGEVTDALPFRWLVDGVRSGARRAVIVHHPVQAHPVLGPEVHHDANDRFDVVGQPNGSVGGRDAHFLTQPRDEVGQEVSLVLRRNHERVRVHHELPQFAAQQLIQPCHDQLLYACSLLADGEDSMRGIPEDAD